MVQSGKTNIALLLILLAGCANIDYHLGDISKAYCGSSNDELRGLLKAKLNESGLTIGVDYCSVHGLVDAVVN